MRRIIQVVGLCRRIQVTPKSLFDKKVGWAGLFAVLLFLPLQAVAEQFEVDGIKYETIDQTQNVKVIANNYSGDVVVPDTVTYNDVDYLVTEIGDNAFKGTKITSISLPSGITKISDFAFQNCTEFTEIDLPDSLTTIGWQAFSGCGSIKKLVIPDKVKRIDRDRFQYCYDLTEVIIGKGVTFIQYGAFQHSFRDYPATIVIPDNVEVIEDGAFTAVQNLRHVVVEGGNVDAPALSLQAFASAPIESLSFNRSIIGFANAGTLKSLTIGNQINEVAEETFAGCTALTELNIEDGTEVLTLPSALYATIESLYLGRDVNGVSFAGNPNLKSVVFGDNFTAIGENMFKDCTGLVSLTIPSTVMSIAANAFEGCNNIKDLVIEDGDTELDLSMFASLPIESVYLGRKVTGLSFAGSETLKSLSVGEGISAIGADEFTGCATLESLTIARSVSELTISENAFAGTALKNLIVADGEGQLKLNAAQATLPVDSIYLGRKLTNFSFENDTLLRTATLGNGYNAIDPGMFRGCTSLTSVVLPETIKFIYGSAFNGCTMLSSINLPDAIKSIEGNAFQDCKSLVELELPDSLETIAYISFGGCKSLKRLVINDKLKRIAEYSFQYCDSLTSVTFGKAVEEIGPGAFKGSFSADSASIIIPGSIKKLDTGVFENCKKLVEVIFEEGGTFETLSDNTFNGCSALASVTIPSNVITISNSAFNECNSLKKLIIADNDTELALPESLGTAPIESVYLGRKISGISFTGSQTLTSLSLGDVYTEIGEGAYKGCPKLAAVKMPAVTTIGASAFENCAALVSISIDSVTSIGTSALAGTALTAATLSDSITAVPDSLFRNCAALAAVNMPAVTTIGLSAFEGCAALVELNMEAVTSIGTSAFAGAGLVSVTLNDSLDSIPDNAFKNCLDLKEVVIPETVTAIGTSAFEGCAALASINIPNGVSTLGASAFSASGLSAVTLGAGLSSIGEHVFSNCMGLESLTLPGTITTIDETAFANCEALAELTVAAGEGTLNLSAFCALPIATLHLERNVEGTPFAGSETLVSLSLGDVYTEVAEESYKNCTGLVEVTMPSVNAIGASAFEGCVALTTLDIESVTSIGASAFAGTSLSSITFNESLTAISDSTFKGCSLTEVAIPAAVKTIGVSAFENCATLASLTIGSGVESIGAAAFKGCALTSINSQATVPSVCATDCFEGVDTESCTLTVPAEAEDSYRVVEVWKDFFEAESGIDEILLNSMKVYCQNGYVILDQVVPGEQISIYTINGILIQKIQVTDSHMQILLPSGNMYLIEYAGQTEKIVL